MKCDICKCNTCTIHINHAHERVCVECYEKEERAGRYMLKTDNPKEREQQMENRRRG